MAEQLRHWFGTIQAGHILGDLEIIDDDDIENWMIHQAIDLEAIIPTIPGLSYASWQCEENPDGGRAHIQIYVEFSRSLRKSQVISRIAGHWERIKTTRTSSRNYTRKSEGRLSDAPFEFGEFRKEGKQPKSETPKAKALELLTGGHTPAEICALYPSVYFTHHYAIDKTWQMMQIAKSLDIVSQEEEE